MAPREFNEKVHEFAKIIANKKEEEKIINAWEEFRVPSADSQTHTFIQHCELDDPEIKTIELCMEGDNADYPATRLIRASLKVNGKEVASLNGGKGIYMYDIERLFHNYDGWEGADLNDEGSYRAYYKGR